MPIIQTNVVLAEQEKVFFKEVEFDFSDICPTGIFMIENITEHVEVKPYVVKGNTVMFNAWITKNIAYKVCEKAYVDKCCIPTVVGEIRHMTKVIQFGGSIDVDLPEGVVFRCTDGAEVLSAHVIGSNEELLCPVEITPGFGLTPQGRGMIGTGLQPMGYGHSVVPTCQPHFEPALYQYKKLREKMCISILVKVVRVEHVNVAEIPQG